MNFIHLIKFYPHDVNPNKTKNLLFKLQLNFNAIILIIKTA